ERYHCFCFFFFQAEDGIRDYKVTGVQTCALPISYLPLLRLINNPCRSTKPLSHPLNYLAMTPWLCSGKLHPGIICIVIASTFKRSEERRVGKECRSRRWSYDEKEKKSK